MRIGPQLPTRHKGVDLEGDESHVERIGDKDIVRGTAQYLLNGKNEGPEHNIWYLIEDLKDCTDLVRIFEASTSSYFAVVQATLRTPVQTQFQVRSNLNSGFTTLHGSPSAASQLLLICHAYPGIVLVSLIFCFTFRLQSFPVLRFFLSSYISFVAI